MLVATQHAGFGAGGGGRPKVVARNTSAQDTAATSHTVDLPAGIVAGDLLIVVFAVRGNPGVTWGGTGFTEFFEVANGANHALALAYRQADGTEGATITVTTGASQKSAHTAYRITGHVNPATHAPEASAGATGNSAAPDPDSLSPTGGAKDYLWLAVLGWNQFGTTLTGYPTNYLNGITKTTSSGNSANVGSAERELNAASENPGAFTLSASEQWIAATVAVHPA